MPHKAPGERGDMARRARTGSIDERTLDLFQQPVESKLGHAQNWPAAERYPLNIAHRKVADTVLADLENSASPLIITGYASLDQLIDFSCAAAEEGAREIRLLFGSEPFASGRESYRLTDDVDNLALDQHAADCLAAFLKKLSNTDRKLLARKKQKALDELEAVLIELIKLPLPDDKGHRRNVSGPAFLV